MTCPKCKSAQSTKDGKTQVGKQYYKCKNLTSISVFKSVAAKNQMNKNTLRYDFIGKDWAFVPSVEY